MGIMMDLIKRGNYVDNPYRNFYEIKAKDLDRNLVSLDQYKRKILLVVHISPYDKDFNEEYMKLIELKNNFNGERFEILAFPSSQLDNIEVTDNEMRNKLLENDLVKNNLEKINLFNRVYVNGYELCEVLKFCYRNSPLFMLREGKSKLIVNNFSKFIITKDGIVNSYYQKGSDINEIHESIDYLIKQSEGKLNIRDDFIKYNKYY